MLSTIAYAGGTIDTRTYDAGGRLSTETLGNGQVVTRSYLTGDNLPASIAEAAVGNYGYGWEASSRRRPMREERGEDAVVSFTDKTSETITGAMSGFSSTMSFDDQDRLTSWNRSSGDSQAWTLSAVNDWQSFTKNGTAEARTHGPAHELLTVGAAPLTHDSRGNMTKDEFAIVRTYDVNNKVKQAVVPVGCPRGIVGTHSYMYDALGRRVRKVVGGSSPSNTVYVYNGEQIVADYVYGATATSPLANYVWGSYIDELVCRVSGTGGTTKLYPHRNQQYSTVALSDQTGAVVERYAYTPYGDVAVLHPTTLAVLTTPPMARYTYTGREHDPETGAYHFRARPYSATLGRFTGHDPIIYPDGPNTYTGWFAASATDPKGRCKVREPIDCCNAALASEGMQGPEKISKINPDQSGGLLCCDGKMILCAYRVPNGPDGSPEITDIVAKAVTYRCTLRHEQAHVPDTRPCNPEFPLYQPVLKDARLDKDPSECRAYKVGIECVNEKKDSCDTARCTDELERLLAALKAKRDYHCKRAGIAP